MVVKAGSPYAKSLNDKSIRMSQASYPRHEAFAAVTAALSGFWFREDH